MYLFLLFLEGLFIVYFYLDYNILVCHRQLFTISGPWQLHGIVAGPGSHPGGGDFGGVAGGQDSEGLRKGLMANLLYFKYYVCKKNITLCF